MQFPSLLERFLRYAKIDTQSDPSSQSFPSTLKQFELAKVLQAELIAMGLQDVQLDENCYLTATLPANVPHKCPTIGFVAHMDTSPDFSGAKVNPKIWENYAGGDLLLNAEQNIVLSPADSPELAQYKGQTLITTDGTTLLGADDKAGVAEIMAAAEYLLQHPEIPRTRLRICFTPDEEIGRGADRFDVAAFGADWAYTMDGSELGELQFENFNAANAVLQIQGKNVHPGFAKDKMVNALHIAQEFIAALPAEERPEYTEGYEGFFHLNSINGDVDSATLRYIIRDHDRASFENRKALFSAAVERLNAKHAGRLSAAITDYYYNMREKVEPLPHILDLAKSAFAAAGVVPKVQPIRGGTDGSRLSFMGLPCPNIFAGGLNFHGRYEYVALETMQAASRCIVHIARLAAERKG